MEPASERKSWLFVVVDGSVDGSVADRGVVDCDEVGEREGWCCRVHCDYLSKSGGLH